ncbi:MAG: DUF1080 domain-containing protein [Verrucomicrobiota bacterium]
MDTVIKKSLGLVLLGCGLAAAAMADSKAKEWEKKGVWVDANSKTLPSDFSIQGEYIGRIEGGGPLGCQVIALGGGAFQAVLYPGGLPGAGWDGKNRLLMDGKSQPVKTVFSPAKGGKKYNGKSLKEFSATLHFPPAGQKDYSATITGKNMEGKTHAGKKFSLRKTLRKSPTLGLKPPPGATVLFNGSNTAEWQGGRIDPGTKLLNTDGRDIRTKRKWNDYTMHVEFMLPFRPSARGQGRGNSGFYQVDHYEVQILDSFGLEGLNNECGGIYKNAKPRVNMCFPPLTWQTYDIEFTNARIEKGKKVKKAQITLKHNGVVIHDKQEVGGPTGGHRGAPEGTPGPVKFQGHGNPLQYRNVWIVEKK